MLQLYSRCCRSYIASGFVKWIESAGGRAVPIRFYASDAELYRIFKSINGIVFPVSLLTSQAQHAKWQLTCCATHVETGS
jgi:hypothetical protein